MPNVTGMNRFYHLCNFHDMCCKYERVLSIIHQQLNREPQEDEVFITILNPVCFLIWTWALWHRQFDSRTFHLSSGEWAQELAALCKQSHGKYIDDLLYAAVNIWNERAVSSRISQEILSRNCQGKKRLWKSSAYDSIGMSTNKY